MKLLEIRNLTLEIQRGGKSARVIDGLSLSVAEGESVCLVGESGCGKSLTALSIARLLPNPPVRCVSGQIWLNGRDVMKMYPRELKEIRGGVVSYVFQEPSAALNPVMRVGQQIMESLKLHRSGAATDGEVLRLLRQVGIPSAETRMRAYPHELSGGMQQRVMIAMALAASPKLLVADEPTTALDATVERQILGLLRTLKERLGMSILWITHNLRIVSQLAERVAVMYAGRLVEVAPAEALTRWPMHPYTQGLMGAIPRLGRPQDRLAAIQGNVPTGFEQLLGCRFEPRCDRAQKVCSEKEPELVQVEPDHWVRCPFWSWGEGWR